MSKRSRIFLQILFILLIPTVLLYLSLGNRYLQGIISILVVIIIFFIAFKEKISQKEMGIRSDNFKYAVLPYVLYTVGGILCLILLAFLFHKQPLEQWWMYSHLQWAFLPISFMQEFIYRSVFQSQLQKVIRPTFAIIIIALLFSSLHILWNDPLILIITFIGAIGWGILWYKYPNLLLITISHSVLNFLIIYLGFFPWLVTDFFNLK